MRAFLFLSICAGIPAFAVPPALHQLLQRAGKAVERSWEQLASVNCRESVSQTKLNKNGKLASRQESLFDYLVVLQIQGEDLIVQESRLPVRQAGAVKKVPLLVTNGFSTALLVFHPFFQGSFEFSPPEEDTLGGRKCVRVKFAHVRNTRSPSALRLKGRDYPIEWQGAAWLDPSAGTLLKIRLELKSAMEDVGLRALRADVAYAPVRFENQILEYWLPSEADIDAETPLQHWRNVHRFAEFKRFTVDTQVITQPPQ
jgi:hypothetical protein